MNALEKTSPNNETLIANNSALFDLDFFTKKPEQQAISPSREPSNPLTPDDVMVDISTEGASNTSKVNNNFTPKPDSPVDNILNLKLPVNNGKLDETPVNNHENSERRDLKKLDVKSLTDINVTLQSVQPSKVPPLTVFEEDEGVTVVLHFCKDKPRPDVNVIVISTTSKSGSSIEDYKFQAVVPKVRCH